MSSETIDIDKIRLKLLQLFYSLPIDERRELVDDLAGRVYSPNLTPVQGVDEL